MFFLRCRKRREDKELYEKSLSSSRETDYDASESRSRTTNIHNIYNIEKRSQHDVSGSQRHLSQLREAYSMDELPRLTRINDHEVQSVDSALLSAEEQDLIDSSLEDERLAAQARNRCDVTSGGSSVVVLKNCFVVQVRASWWLRVSR